MNPKRLIITSTISLILVSILFIGSTYSVFTTTSPDEEINNYKTGNLNIEVIGDETTIKNISPTKDKDSNKLEPYHLTIKNNGTVPYKCNISLVETTTTDKIDNKYIMTKVGKLDSISLNDCKDNIIKKDIIIESGQTQEIDIRIWISDRVPNTEINKSFFAKIKVDGEATKTNNIKIDNSSLINPKQSDNTPTP